ncbi:Fe-S metabolism protein SufE [Thermaurantimonas aggregans]|uniref:Fe-S metabolism protein SufE n=1 Tax=Thermaurantimonas aggregans TaxID=2173829 RepID=A0A401XJ53_9FLAO|nr:SufE family protein [Thermaurantimonas aggregans]MCX8148980.1 SufE family protein [Thermaurantimonas aggregans]GCD77004.1 Fe-S metabolism protein SufE [Thermaurantimonas aggregans]
MPSIAEIQEEIVQEFEMFDNWEQKYEYIIDLGKELPLLDPKYKVDENLIKGCQSRVWLHAHLGDNGRIRYTADSDAIITKGIVALLIRVFDNQLPQDIVDADIHFIEKIGLKQHLSPTRANGLLAMIKQMKYYALALNQLTQPS